MTFAIGDCAVVINEADKLYGKRGVVEEVDAAPGVTHHPLLGLRFVGFTKLSPFWPTELRHVSAVDQLSELV